MRVHLEPLPAAISLPATPRVATGHQAQLFHPGILAKYLATTLAYGGSCPVANIVVDQDAYDPLRLDIPRREGDRLTVHVVHLAPVVTDVPIGCQPAADVETVCRALRSIGDQALPLASAMVEAFEQVGQPHTLAQQMAAVLGRVMRRWCSNGSRDSGWIKHLFASGLLQKHHRAIIEALLSDAAHAARLYNEAVSAFPAAGMTPMRIEPDRVEVPLWRLQWMRPRQRVFVDLADARPIFTNDAGDPIDDPAELAPRALLMTAAMRQPASSDLFIHGSGGWAYDRITERWWQAWQGKALAPMALATADLRLDFDAPVNDQAELHRAVWFDHHIRHNIDRFIEGDTELTMRKRALLARMDDDRDRRRRRAAFDEIHRINATLRRLYPEAIDAAIAAVERARVGVANQAVARRRDWFFGLYPQAKLDALRDAVESCQSQEPT